MSSQTHLRLAEIAFEANNKNIYYTEMKIAINKDTTDKSRFSRAKIKEKIEKGSGIGDYRTIVERNIANLEAIQGLANCIVKRGEIEEGIEEFKILV